MGMAVWGKPCGHHTGVSHIQLLACSFRALVGPLTALADQLPRVVGCASGPEKVLTFDPGQAPFGPDEQHSDSGLHQPSG